jgi:DNA-binding IclR family transcriptional regulator
MARAQQVFDVAALAAPAPHNGPRSILRVLQVFERLSTCPEGQTLAQLCRALALPKTTLFTMLKVLESAGYLAQTQGVYRLGQAAAALGASMARTPSADFPECAKGILQRLSQRSGETVFLAALTRDRKRCKYVATAESDNWLRYSVKLGSHKPSYATGTGRAMLAYLPDSELKALLDDVRFERITPGTVSSRRALVAGLKEVRRRGVSTVDSGTVAGVTSVAAPIFGADGQVAAALSIGGPTARIGLHLRTVEAAVRGGAAEISRLLGYGGEWPPVR